MSVIKHTGKTPPMFKEWFDPDSSKWVWVSYPSTKVILSSTWILPSGFTQVNTKMAETVNVDGVAYANSNAVEIKPNGAKEGVYTITNRVVFADGGDDKSVVIQVRNT